MSKAQPVHLNQGEWIVKIRELIANEMRVDPSTILPQTPFTEYGLDSIAALAIAGELEDLSGLELPPTLLWDCQTAEALAQYLADQTRMVA